MLNVLARQERSTLNRKAWKRLAFRIFACSFAGMTETVKNTCSDRAVKRILRDEANKEVTEETAPSFWASP